MQNLDREIEDLLFRKEFYLLKNKLLNIDPTKKNYIFYNILGYVYQELGELKKAEDSYLKSLSLNNNFLEAKFNLAVLFYKKKILNKAEELFIDYIDQDKNNYLCYFPSRRRHKRGKNYFSNPICVPILNTHLSGCQVSREK